MIPGGTGYNEYSKRIKKYRDQEEGEEELEFAFADS